MGKLLKKILRPVLVPIVKNHIGSECKVRFAGLELQVQAGVFHPGLFFSTNTFRKFIELQNVDGLRALEIGTGSGALAIFASKLGAVVTAVDINPTAVECAMANAQRNSSDVKILQSDLFEAVAGEKFDRIIINPPFYPKNPQTISEHAWYCGSDYEFFRKFFQHAEDHLTSSGEIWMVLSDDCDLDNITGIAKANGFSCSEIYRRRTWLEQNYIMNFCGGKGHYTIG